MNNQNLALNLSAVYAGLRALQSSTQVIFGSNSAKDRSNIWQSATTDKGYVSAFCKTAQVLIGTDSLSTRILNFTKGFVFATGTYLLANLSDGVSKAEANIAKMDCEIQVAKGKIEQTDACIEKALSQNFLDNVDSLFSRVQDLISTNRGLVSTNRGLVSTNTDLTSNYNTCTGELGQKQTQFTDFQKEIKNLQEDIQNLNKAIAGNAEEIKTLTEASKCKQLNADLLAAQSNCTAQAIQIANLTAQDNSRLIEIQQCHEAISGNKTEINATLTIALENKQKLTKQKNALEEQVKDLTKELQTEKHKTTGQGVLIKKLTEDAKCTEANAALKACKEAMPKEKTEAKAPAQQ